MIEKYVCIKILYIFLSPSAPQSPSFVHSSNYREAFNARLIEEAEVQRSEIVQRMVQEEEIDIIFPERITEERVPVIKKKV